MYMKEKEWREELINFLLIYKSEPQSIPLANILFKRKLRNKLTEAKEGIIDLEDNKSSINLSPGKFKVNNRKEKYSYIKIKTNAS